MALQLDLSQPQRRLHELTRALKQVEGGKDIRRELVKELRKEAQPARQAVRKAILSMPSSSNVRPSLRRHVAQRVTVAAKPQGRLVGVRVVAKKAKVRGFTQAPKKLNSSAGWRHPVFGDRTRWVTQIGKPGWFDDTLRNHSRQFQQAADAAMDRAAEIIARRV